MAFFGKYTKYIRHITIDMTLELISVSDTLVINGVEYYDVVCIRAIGQNTYLYYWSKNIGLVKIKSETDNRQLKSYHINN